MTALYVLAGEFRQAADQLADLDLDEQTVADTLESMGGDLEVKASNVAMFARNLEATAAAIKEAEAQMAQRRKAIEKRAENVRAYILRCMESAGIKKIDSPHLSLTIKANPPSVDVFDPAQIPEHLMRQKPPPPPEPDKTAIKAVLSIGQEVPGARLVKGSRLEVK